jgi:hypothetical protein
MMTLEKALTSGRYSPAVIEKARRLYRLNGVRPDEEYPDVFWVRSGTEAGREYRVQLYDHFASCSCKHGIHTGSDATCAHPLAAMTYVKENGLERPSGEDAGPVHRYLTPDGDLPDAPF